MKIDLKIAISLIMAILLSLPTKASNKGVAKVIILKGTVEAHYKGKKPIPLKKGMWLNEGAVVKTKPKSFAKLLFIDKSSMNVGPKSEMEIKAFPKEEAGIINLMKGQIRSKVTKDYMNMKEKNKSKLFIKTKTAAMGVRGTDFQVNYNPINEATSLVTFEGNVAMAQLTNLGDIAINQTNLEAVVSSDQAVEVKKGQYSGASPKTPRATIPVKISPVQLETLKASEVPGVSPAEASGTEGASTNAPPPPKKAFRSVIPPGVDAKAFSNEAKEIDSTMSETVGKEVVNEVKVEIAKEQELINTPPPEGMVDTATGEVAPTAGGFIDLGTAQYIPPPPGSQFDPNAGVFIPPPSVGTVDPETGGFKNDHYQLTADGKFVPKEFKAPEGERPEGEGPPKGEQANGPGNNGAPGAPKDGLPPGGPVNGPDGAPLTAGDAPPIGPDGGPIAEGPGEFKPVDGPNAGSEFNEGPGAPPPPPPEVTFLPTMMDPVDMAEVGDLLAPPPPPANMALAPPPPGEAGSEGDRGPASIEGGALPPGGPGPNGPPGAPGTAGPNGPPIGPDGQPLPPGEAPPLGPDGAPLPPPGGEFFGDHPPPEFDGGNFEDFAEQLAEDHVSDIQDNHDANLDNVVNQGTTTTSFSVNAE